MADPKSIEIKRNDTVHSHEIEELRLSVGWNDHREKNDLAVEKSYATYCVKESNELIAFARVISDGVLYSFIVDLIVHPKYQNHSVGKQLVQQIIDDLKTDGIRYIQLTFDPSNEEFYKKCGFEIIKAGSILNSSKHKSS